MASTKESRPAGDRAAKEVGNKTVSANPTDQSPQKQASKRHDPAALAVIDLLVHRFPKAFAWHELRRRPLKVGIHDDILAAFNGTVTPAELSKALRVYVTNKIYRSRLKAGATRIDLDGNPAGVVTAEQARAFVDKPKPARSPAPPSSPAPPAPTKRDGLADLRAAAQRRKAQEAMS